ncbi:MAG: hypothetical protein HPY53_11630 [Brevinematales bacterium]|nr:hypothetical protein [Brevinematales bacterium]
MNHSYTLENDGDILEQQCWKLFLKDQFQNYEIFWIKHIVPLTNRPKNIHFKTNEELEKNGKTENDLCIAQLHYTTLRHLYSVFTIILNDQINLDLLTFGISRIVGAQDTAFELLERITNLEDYEQKDPWDEKEGEKARRAWQNNNQTPLQNIRHYRNHLIHGRLSPSYNGLFPSIEKEKFYIDWRKITDENQLPIAIKDLTCGQEILRDAWNQTIDYFQNEWGKII